jgi:uncharacterized Fe-S cluster-containing protein
MLKRKKLFHCFIYQKKRCDLFPLYKIKEKKKPVYLSLFLSLSFTHFTMNYKKHASLLSVKIGIDSSNYGKIDTFESIY